MGILKRATLHIRRRKSRTLVLFLLTVSLSVLCLASIQLKSLADREGRALAESLGSSFILKADTNNMGYYEYRTGDGYAYQVYTGPKVTTEILQTINGINGVTDYFVNEQTAQWTSLKLCPGLWNSLLSPPDDTSDEEYRKFSRQTTSIIYSRRGELHPYFQNGAFQIIKGRNIEEKDQYKAIISEAMSERNQVDLGDTFQVEVREGMVKPSNTPNRRYGEPIQLEIIGIFRLNVQQEVSDYTVETNIAENYIFTDWGTREKINNIYGKTTGEEEYTEVTFFVESPEILDEVMDEVEGRVNLNGLLLEKDDSSYAASVRPYRQVGIFAAVLLTVLIVGGSIILYLLHTLWNRSRRKEMGTYLSLGISRRQITGQFVLESILVTAAAFVMSCILAGPLIRGAGKLAEDLTAPKAGTQAYSVADTITGNIKIQKVSSERIVLDADLTAAGIGWTAAVVFGVSAGSVLAATRKNTGKDPKQLLDSI